MDRPMEHWQDMLAFKLEDPECPAWFRTTGVKLAVEYFRDSVLQEERAELLVIGKIEPRGIPEKGLPLGPSYYIHGWKMRNRGKIHYNPTRAVPTVGGWTLEELNIISKSGVESITCDQSS